MTASTIRAGAIHRAVLPLIRPVSSYFRRRMLRLGDDATAALTPGAALILAPHPDDETLGCGALIMRKRDAGVPVHVVIATDGSRSHPEEVIAREELVRMRSAEALQAAQLMGLRERDVTFLGYEDGYLSRSSEAVVRDLVDVIDRVRPELIAVASINDAHPDHQALARAARTAVRSSRSAARLYEYPVWYWNRLPWKRRPGLLTGLWWLLYDPIVELFRTPPLRVRTQGYLHRKRDALAAHASQVRPLGEDEGALLPADFVAHFFQEHEVYFPVRMPAPPPGEGVTSR